MSVGPWNDYLECNVPIVARCGDDTVWVVSLELPAELEALQPAVRVAALAAMSRTARELRALGARGAQGACLPQVPLLRFDCALVLRRSGDDDWRHSVKYLWPELWAELCTGARDAILAAAEAVLEARIVAIDSASGGDG